MIPVLMMSENGQLYLSPTLSSPVNQRSLVGNSSDSYHLVKMDGEIITTSKGSSSDNLSQLSQPNSDASLLSNMEIPVGKYQLVLNEYVKFRAQCKVLKEAVLDEKNKNEELTEKIRVRDQTVRRLEQESESLQFRNQQLTKRIAVLQKDLENDSVNSSQKRTFFFGTVMPSVNTNGNIHDKRRRSASNSSNVSSIPSVDLTDELNLELKNKIEENERLKELIAKLDDERLVEQQMFDKKLKEVERRAEDRVHSISEEVKALNNTINKINAEKSAIMTQLRDVTQKYENNASSMEAIKRENEQLQTKLTKFEKQLIAAKQYVRLMQHQQQPQQLLQVPVPTTASVSITTTAVSGGDDENRDGTVSMPRSGSFSGVVRSSGSFSRGNIIRSGSLSCNGSHQLVANRLGSAFTSKELTLSAATSQEPTPSLSSKSYQDPVLRDCIIKEFALKVKEIVCSLSTVHSSVAKKIQILFAMYNKNVDHFYFYDIAGAISTLKSSSQTNSSTVPSINRSEYIFSILRKLSTCIQADFDTHLIHLEEVTLQFLANKMRYFKVADQAAAFSDANHRMVEMDLQMQKQIIRQRSKEIVEKLSDYIDYLNRLNPCIVLCLNYWCKNLQEYDSTNVNLVKMLGLDATSKAKLANKEKRTLLCQKQIEMVEATSQCIGGLVDIFNNVQKLLCDEVPSSNYLNIFNQFLHSISSLEKSFDDMKQLCATKMALEHDLGITTEKSLLSTDDCILSSMGFFRKSLKDVRQMLEMHYFFFVNYEGNPTQKKNPTLVVNDGIGLNAKSTSPLTISGQLIPEEEDEGDDDEDDDDDDDDDGDDDVDDSDVEEQHESEVELPRSDKNEDKSFEITTQISQANVVTEVSPSTDIHTHKLANFEEQIKKYHKEMVQLKEAKEQKTVESELVQLKLEQEQRKVTELELRIQELTTKLNNLQIQQQPKSQPLPIALNRVNSNSNSLTSGSGKSLDEKASISSGASLQSPTIDCFGIAYPSVDTAHQVNSKETGNFNETALSTVVTDLSDQLNSNGYHTVSTKLGALLDYVQLADSRAATFQQECQALRQRYLQLNHEKEQIECQYSEKQQRLGTVEEEYHTSVENYEIQLQTMSEHLAEMNEKLTAQRDEIDLLKYQQQQMAASSGKTSSATSTMSNTIRRSFKKGSS